MKLRCKHGYFIFEETAGGQISDYMSLTGLDLVPVDDYYTFAALEAAPDYSLVGKAMLGINAIATFEGKPWQVFEANGFVYNFTTGLVVPISTISQAIKIQMAGNVFISPGLILPGSLTADGDRVKDYSAWYSRTTQRWQYSEVTYV